MKHWTGWFIDRKCFQALLWFFLTDFPGQHHSGLCPLCRFQLTQLERQKWFTIPVLCESVCKCLKISFKCSKKVVYYSGKSHHYSAIWQQYWWATCIECNKGLIRWILTKFLDLLAPKGITSERLWVGGGRWLGAGRDNWVSPGCGILNP